MNLGQFCWFTVQMFPRIYIYYEKTLLGVGGPGLHCQSVAADLLLSDHSEQDYEHLSKLSAAAAQQCWKQMAGCLLTNGFVNMTQRNLCCWLWRETFLSWLWSRRKQNTFSPKHVDCKRCLLRYIWNLFEALRSFTHWRLTVIYCR